MKGRFLSTLFLAISVAASAQLNVDSMQQTAALSSSKAKIDSLLKKVAHLPDSLVPSFHKIDSIRNQLNLAADSIQTEYENTVSRIDAQTKKLNQSIDSLRDLNLPATTFTKRLDSLNQIVQSIQKKFNSKLNVLKTKTIDKVKAIDLPPECREPPQQMTKHMDALSVNSRIVKIPALDLP